MKFLDEVRVFIRSGAGGRGCVSFRREKFIEFGGPNGGDGGRGGSVYAEAVNNLNTLIDYRYNQHIKGQNGESGRGANCTGASGNDGILRLPVGTQILADDGETLLADLTEVGQRVLLLRGGNGGFGNSRFKGSVNQAPRHANPGQPAMEARICLRLKLIADAGLVGLPNAGKSTFLAAVSAARPKIADYPFTTLHPNLGTIAVDDDAFVLADIPGLIEGAHEGHGLGDQFLRHIERCAVLLHLIDATQEDPVGAYHIIQHELASYSGDLASKPQIVALNKCDAILDEDLEPIVQALSQAVPESSIVRTISAVSGLGVRQMVQILYQPVLEMRHERIAKHKASQNAPHAPVLISHQKRTDTDYLGVAAPYTREVMEHLYANDDAYDDEDEDAEG